MPLKGTNQDKGWGRVDIVGATADVLPAVLELKRGRARDTPLRMLVEGLAYACAVRKAWNEGRLRAEWVAAQKQNGFRKEPELLLCQVPVILVAPTDFWNRVIGSPGTHSNGKVREDIWPSFLELVKRCNDHGFPVHFVQIEIDNADQGKDPKITNVSRVQLPRYSPNPPNPS